MWLQKQIPQNENQVKEAMYKNVHLILWDVASTALICAYASGHGFNSQQPETRNYLDIPFFVCLSFYLSTYPLTYLWMIVLIL